MDISVDTTKPMIRAASAPWLHRAWASGRAPGPGAWFQFSASARAVDLAKLDLEELRVFPFNRIAIRRHAATRANSVFGRLYNRMSGEDPDDLELSGGLLAQAATTSAIDPSGRYNLRRDIVERALERVTQELEKTAT